MSVLFRLPRELRDQIYECCLVRGQSIRPNTPAPWEEPKYGLGLLRVSRAVSVEAVPVLYGRNILDFTLTYCHEVDRFFE
ncbi:hypothetical protein PG999_007732 [Apiospora kogelbergensis]|uniref:Uncharacterized protein n=1 Tax=Apiospora kogelbergensis TaxID=1337665 RepID=A0AAW0QS38_9PEZI